MVTPNVAAAIFAPSAVILPLTDWDEPLREIAQSTGPLTRLGDPIKEPWRLLPDDS